MSAPRSGDDASRAIRDLLLATTVEQDTHGSDAALAVLRRGVSDLMVTLDDAGQHELALAAISVLSRSITEPGVPAHAEAFAQELYFRVAQRIPVRSALYQLRVRALLAQQDYSGALAVIGAVCQSSADGSDDAADDYLLSALLPVADSTHPELLDGLLALEEQYGDDPYCSAMLVLASVAQRFAADPQGLSSALVLLEESVAASGDEFVEFYVRAVQHGVHGAP